jgi:hypothetical protein
MPETVKNGVLELNLPAWDYKLTKLGGRLCIWDTCRKKYVALTPEEWVRQHFVNYLVTEKGCPASLIRIESSQTYNTRMKRADIVVYNSERKPVLLVECKASHHPVSESNLQQALTYNSKLNAPYLALTNGMEHRYAKFAENGFTSLESLPHFAEMV